MRLEHAIREAVLAEIRTTLGSAFSDIADVVKKHPEVADLSLGQVFGGGTTRGGGVRAAGGAVDTRTAAGREAYEKSVLRVLEAADGPVSSQHVRDKCGGTALQARKALNRLIEDGQVTYTGKARATKYELV